MNNHRQSFRAWQAGRERWVSVYRLFEISEEKKAKVVLTKLADTPVENRRALDREEQRYIDLLRCQGYDVLNSRKARSPKHETPQEREEDDKFVMERMHDGQIASPMEQEIDHQDELERLQIPPGPQVAYPKKKKARKLAPVPAPAPAPAVAPLQPVISADLSVEQLLRLGKPGKAPRRKRKVEWEKEADA